MECKSEKYNCNGGSIWELIDTLWNVNKTKKYDFERTRLWINRYIMECKSFCKNTWYSISVVN